MSWLLPPYSRRPPQRAWNPGIAHQLPHTRSLVLVQFQGDPIEEVFMFALLDTRIVTLVEVCFHKAILRTCCRLPQSMELPAEMELVFTMRFFTLSNKRAVSRKGATTFTAHVSSNPSSDFCMRSANTPAPGAKALALLTAVIGCCTCSARSMQPDKAATQEMSERGIADFMLVSVH